MAALDHDKLAKVLALAGSDQDGEALAALRKAQGMLKAAGKTFADLTQPASVARAPAPQKAAGPSFVDIFAGFNDHMEAKELGWKAKQAAARADRLKREAAEREAAIAKYGSVEAAREPTERERLLDAATLPFQREVMYSFANGEFPRECLDGWMDDCFSDKGMSIAVRAAVMGAFPMPTTLRAARDETRWWEARDRELERVWCLPGEVGGDTYLDLPSRARLRLVEGLWKEGAIKSLDDLLVRIEFSVEWPDRMSATMHKSILEAFNRLVLGDAGDLDAMTAAAGAA